MERLRILVRQGEWRCDVGVAGRRGPDGDVSLTRKIGAQVSINGGDGCV
jgi:hypothetical protein